jgi:chemotaxis signal transduction protein
MTNKGLLHKINMLLKNKQQEEQPVIEHYKKLLVFHINAKKYAFYAEEVGEIINTDPVFFIPFVPEYIRGLINCHGEPYTVFDLNVLFEKVKLDSQTFLVINDEQDRTAFIISDIIEIVKWPEKEIHVFGSHDGESAFFTGVINLNGAAIFIIRLSSLLERLKNDLEKF